MNQKLLLLPLMCGIGCATIATGCGKSSGTFSARIVSSSYDSATKTLTIEVDYENSLNEPVFLVANGYDFPRHLWDAAYPQKLNIVDDGQVLLIDLSEPTIIDANLISNSEEYEFITSRTVEIPPGEKLHVTYTFTFPMKLHRGFSKVESIAAPIGKRNVKLQVGWGVGQDNGEFLQEQRPAIKTTSRNFDEAIVRNNSLIRDKWQHVTVVSCSVDFGPPSTGSAQSKGN